MNKWFESLSEDVWPVVVSALAIYIVMLVFTRIFGKRTFAKMSSFDFGVTIALGSIVASVILLESVSLVQGVVGLASLYLLQAIVASLRRFDNVQQLVGNQPLLLMKGQTVFDDNLKKAHVTLSDLKGKLREANVINREQIRAVIFEPTGDISVLHVQSNHQEIDEWIMEDVQN